MLFVDHKKSIEQQTNRNHEIVSHFTFKSETKLFSNSICKVKIKWNNNSVLHHEDVLVVALVSKTSDAYLLMVLLFEICQVQFANLKDIKHPLWLV